MEGRSVCVGVWLLAAVNRLPRKVTGAVSAVGRPLLSPVAAEPFSWRKAKVKLHYSIPFLIGLHTHWLLLVVPVAVDVLLQEKHSGEKSDSMTVQENERQL